MKSANPEKGLSNEKSKGIRVTNITAAKAVADTVRTSLGPRGMDKMIKDGKGEVMITNDGATIMKQMEVLHPTAKMLVELSKAQDIEAGDGTTSVVVIAGSLLNSCTNLLDKGIHPSQISDSFKIAGDFAASVLEEMSIRLDLSDTTSLEKIASTSLASKVVSQHSQELAPIAVRAVMSLVSEGDANVDLRNIKVSKKLGGTVDDSELVDGLVFATNHASHAAGGPTKMDNPRIALIQFCLSSPKTDMENNVIVQDYAGMDRILREERKYIVNVCKKIVDSGCNVLLIQKSVLRDATNDLSLHYLAKHRVMVVRDIDREDVDFVSRTLGITPIAHLDQLTAERLGQARLVEEETVGEGKIIRIRGCSNNSPHGKTASILLRGSNQLVLDEAERSIHDALCVIRSLVKKKALVPGGGAPEMEMSVRLMQLSRTLVGAQSICIRSFAEALDIVPYTLAENAGLNPINIVTDLRNRHVSGDKYAGINVRRGGVSNMLEENVLQPLLVPLSALNLATECVRMILKIDDVVMVR